MKRRAFLSLLAVVSLMVARSALATTFVVDQNNPAANDANNGTAEAPFKSISRAARMTRPGDTVIVRTGIYRESVILENSGRPGKPIEFVADPLGSVVVTGSGPIELSPVPETPGVYRAAWENVFAIDHDEDGKAIEFHPDSEPLWGRAEQVTVDDQLLLPANSFESLKARKGSPKAPIAKLGGPFAGWFYVDSGNKTLYIRLSDGSNPAGRKVEAATRDLLFGTTPFMNERGVLNVHVRGFVFRDGATFPQRAGVWLHGQDNLLEDCIVERMAGTGVSVSGTMRRCIIRNNGHTGGGATGDGFLNENCTWEGNSWKPISRSWEAGGMKLTDCAGGAFNGCNFIGNGGPGLWLDVNVRDVTISECIFEGNETSGLFIEISQRIQVTNNLMLRNGVGTIGRLDDSAWSVGGIQIAESLSCTVKNNTVVGNRDGITLREQGPRNLPTTQGEIPFHNEGHIITNNVIADNEGYQLAFWYDGDRYEPSKQNFTIDHNLYHRDGKGSIVLYKARWRDDAREFTSLDEMRKLRFDASSIVADPGFVHPGALDFRLSDESRALRIHAGWTAPRCPRSQASNFRE